MKDLQQRVALRYLAEDSQWQSFLDEKYDGGKKQVPNTNPKTRDQNPQVSVNTLMKSDPNFRKKIQEEYAAWGEGSDEDEDAGYDAKLLDISLDDDTPAATKLETRIPPSYQQWLDVEIQRMSKSDRMLAEKAEVVGIDYMDSLSEEDREMFNDVVSDWCRSVNTTFGLQLRKWLGEDPSGFKTEDYAGDLVAWEDALEPEDLDIDPEVERVLQQQYNFTQAWFKKQGITHVTLYRGVTGQGLDKEPPAQGDEVDLDTYAASSWTIDPGCAGSFGRRIVKAVVPVSQIFMSPLTNTQLAGPESDSNTNAPARMDENEYVVLGTKGSIRCNVSSPIKKGF